jgi:hypothetical protein
MTEFAIVIVGILMSAGGLAAFLWTWQILLRHPERYLLGGVETIWLKCLTRIVYVGLVVVILGVMSAVLRTYLFWRHA